MSEAALPYSSYGARSPVRDRVVSALLALAVAALIVLMLIELGVVPDLTRGGGSPLTLLNLTGGTPIQASRSRSPAKAAHAATHASSRAAAVKPPPPPPIPSPVPAWNVTPLGRDDLAVLDGKMASRSSSAPSEEADAGGAESGRGGAGGGRGAGYGQGDQLYRADWYRKPTDAELASYMPHRGVVGGFGEIACRTAPDYQVEDCHELAETPGSGFARTLREAAWQFKVLPPRLDGRPIIGAWVRIHFDFIPTIAEGSSG